MCSNLQETGSCIRDQEDPQQDGWVSWGEGALVVAMRYVVFDVLHYFACFTSQHHTFDFSLLLYIT